TAAQIAVVDEVGGRHLTHMRERMVAVRDQYKLVASQFELDKLRVGCALDQGAIERAREDVPVELGRWVDGDAQLDPRKAPAELCEVRREVVSGAGRACPEVEGAGLEFLDGERRIVDDLDRPEGGPAGVGHGASRAGEAHT